MVDLVRWTGEPSRTRQKADRRPGHRRRSFDELRALIERRKAEDWQFLFLGADLDAYAAARSFGIVDESTVAYSGRRTTITLRETASAFSDYARGRARRVRFTAAPKRAAGDRYAEGDNSARRDQRANQQR